MAVLAAVTAPFEAVRASDLKSLVGTWISDCRPDLRCRLEIALQSKASIRVVYIAADRADPAKILCQVESTLKLGKARLRDEILPSVPNGKFGSTGQKIILLADARSISVIGTDNQPCGKPLASNGSYVPVGN
jgi:hypothetical protein